MPAKKHTNRATSSPDTSNLSQTARRGVSISFVSLIAVQTVALVQVVVIARLLTPAEVGIYAAGVVLTGLLLTFTEGGLHSALVQRATDIDDAAETVFWASLGYGLLTSLAALAAAPLVEVVFESPTAGLIAAVTSGTLLLHSLTTVPDTLMQRRFNFRRRLIVEPGIAVTHAAVAIPLCAAGFGVWGLVIGSYASYIFWVVATWSLVRWRPRTVGRASYALWRQLARYSLPLIIGTIGVQLREAFETVLVARVLDAAALGHFRYGRRLSQIPAQAVLQIGGFVLFPAFSRIADDAARMRRVFLRVLAWLFLGSAALAGLLVAVAEPAVVILLGEPWRATGIALAAMAGFGPGVALSAVALEAIKGSGRTRLLNRITILSLALGVVLLLLLAPLGLVGIGIAVSAEALVVGLVSVILARRVVDVSVVELVRRVVPPMVAAVVATFAVGRLEHLLLRSDEQPVVLGLAFLVVDALAFMAIYLAVLCVVHPRRTKRLARAACARSRRVPRQNGDRGMRS